MPFLVSDITMSRSASTDSTISTLSAKTRHLLALNSKFVKALTTFPSGNSIKQFKELMNFQRTSDESQNKTSKKKNKNSRNQIKQIKVITRNDLLANTYDLEFNLPKKRVSHSTQSNPHGKLKKSNSTRCNRSHPKYKMRNSTSQSLPTLENMPSSVTTNRHSSVTFHIESMHDIDDISDHDPFVPADNLVKKDLVIMRNSFADDGALLSIPICKTVSRTDSEISRVG